MLKAAKYLVPSVCTQGYLCTETLTVLSLGIYKTTPHPQPPIPGAKWLVIVF